VIGGVFLPEHHVHDDGEGQNHGGGHRRSDDRPVVVVWNTHVIQPFTIQI